MAYLIFQCLTNSANRTSTSPRLRLLCSSIKQAFSRFRSIFVLAPFSYMDAGWRRTNPPRRRIVADPRRRIAAAAREGTAARRATHAGLHEWREMRPQCGVSGVGRVLAGDARVLVIRLCWLRGQRGSQRARSRRAVHATTLCQPREARVARIDSEGEANREGGHLLAARLGGGADGGGAPHRCCLALRHLESHVKIRIQDFNCQNSRLRWKGTGEEATQPMRKWKGRRSPPPKRPCGSCGCGPCPAAREVNSNGKQSIIHPKKRLPRFGSGLLPCLCCCCRTRL
jgi:hypothetical protein